MDDDGLYYKPGRFTASVWYDNDQSQTKNNTEQPVPNASVQVYDSANRLVGTYPTNAQGMISGSLIPGTYTFKLVEISNYVITTLKTTSFTIMSEIDQHVYDFGIVPMLPNSPAA